MTSLIYAPATKLSKVSLKSLIMAIIVEAEIKLAGDHQSLTYLPNISSPLSTREPLVLYN